MSWPLSPGRLRHPGTQLTRRRNRRSPRKQPPSEGKEPHFSLNGITGESSMLSATYPPGVGVRRHVAYNTRKRRIGPNPTGCDETRRNGSVILSEHRSKSRRSDSQTRRLQEFRQLPVRLRRIERRRVAHRKIGPSCSKFPGNSLGAKPATAKLTPGNQVTDPIRPRHASAPRPYRPLRK